MVDRGTDEWLEQSLGTPGGGTHFIEVDRSADGTNFLVNHSKAETWANR